MVDSFVAALKSICAEASEVLESELPVECRHFFSGAAAYANGQIFMSLTPAGLALKLPEKAQMPLLSEGAKPLRYFPQGPIKKNYVVLPASYADDICKLAPLIRTSLDYVGSLPKPPKRAKAQTKKPSR